VGEAVKIPAKVDPAKADLAERMVYVAEKMIEAVHDKGQEAVRRVLAPLDPDERVALTVMLAAMIDPSKPSAERLAWVTWDDNGLIAPATRAPIDLQAGPPGNRHTWSDEACRALHAAFARGERTGPVMAGEQEYQRRRSIAYRAAKRNRQGKPSTTLTVVRGDD
jgi:hypothetical protein